MVLILPKMTGDHSRLNTVRHFAEFATLLQDQRRASALSAVRLWLEEACPLKSSLEDQGSGGRLKAL